MTSNIHLGREPQEERAVGLNKIIFSLGLSTAISLRGQSRLIVRMLTFLSVPLNGAPEPLSP